MATVAEVQRQRKNLVREIRRKERSTDSSLERLERRLFQLLARKTLITAKDMNDLLGYYDRFVTEVQALEKSIADSAYSISLEF